MSRTFKKVDYDRGLDLAVRLGDCLPPDHLARFVVDSVAQLDLSALYAHYGSYGGNLIPRNVAELAAQCVSHWVFSRARLSATYESVAFHFIVSASSRYAERRRLVNGA